METDSIIKSIDIVQIKENKKAQIKDAVIDEDILTIIINKQKAFEMVFSMTHATALAAGFLFTQGIVINRTDILDTQWLPDKKECCLTLSAEALDRFKQFKKGSVIKGSSGGSLLLNPADGMTINPADSFSLSADQVLSLIHQHWESSKLFHKTGAVHSAGLCDADKMIDYYEDIGRHNAVDKLAGNILLNRTQTSNRVATLSCRMSLEIIGKIIKTRIPVVISNAAPTLSAVKLADKAGLTLIGFARNRQFNIYTHPFRVILD
ncbi:MAG: formate dehydrogenase accessory sulfurtransferase FdhD [Pseudomonadota bacterium]